MQSQLAAALLGHTTATAAAATTATTNSTTPDDFKEEPLEEDVEDIDDFIIDEECDGENGNRSAKHSSGASTGRTITLQMLLSAGILQPGSGTMSIEYLGQRFVGDLLPDGKIRSQETDIVFASPSAWAIACKRIINPEKKSGCGWASVKYRGRKLDAYKNIWYKRKKEQELLLDKEDEISEGCFIEDMDNEQHQTEKAVASQMPIQRIVVKHNTIANRTFTHDANTLVECVPFSNLGKIQPFLVSLSTNAALLMDFHCHLTMSEVSGYLAGHWDVNSHTLSITTAFPCRCTKADRDNAHQVEGDIQKAIESQQLTLVGWYHCHPTFAATPTLRDVDAQLEYQIRMKGNSDNSYTPCVGLIISPYNMENLTLESNIIAYWVIPPPETKPNEYGRPMLMSYSVLQDTNLSPNLKEEMNKCAKYYLKEHNFVKFLERMNNTTTYLEKLKTTLTSKFPRDQTESSNLWSYVKEIMNIVFEEKPDPPASAPPLLTVPKVPQVSSSSSQQQQQQQQQQQDALSNLSSNLMLNASDLANVLFQAGKFPSTSSLLGLPDPMSRSTLAANNMFLSPNLFKMQDTLNLLQPLSSSSPIASTSKDSSSSKTGASLKIPRNKSSSSATSSSVAAAAAALAAAGTSSSTPSLADFSTDLNILALRNQLEFAAPDLNITVSKSSSKLDFSASDLSISSVKTPKVSSDFSASDLSISSVMTTKTPLTSMIAPQEEPLAKVPKIAPADYSSATLDLSVNSSRNSSLSSSAVNITATSDGTLDLSKKEPVKEIVENREPEIPSGIEVTKVPIDATTLQAGSSVA